MRGIGAAILTVLLCGSIHPQALQPQPEAKKATGTKTVRQPRRIKRPSKKAVSLNQYLDLTSQLLPSQLGVATLRNFFVPGTLPLGQRHNTLTGRSAMVFNDSLRGFIRKEYNTHDYADRLSRDLSHFVEFLKVGDEFGLGVEPMYACQRLLFNKVKWCEIVDYTEVAWVLKRLPNLLERYFSAEQKPPSFEFIRKTMDVTMLDQFTNHLPLFHHSPDTFVTQLAQRLTQMTYSKLVPTEEERDQQEVRERFRSLMKQVVEQLFGKMMWNPQAVDSIKPSFISMGNSIVRLAEAGVLNHMDDVDDLIGTLVCRLCYFFNVYGSAIPTQTYDGFLADIESGSLFFLEIEEQDKDITTKKDLLMRHIVNAKARSLALEKEGMHTDTLL